MLAAIFPQFDRLSVRIKRRHFFGVIVDLLFEPTGNVDAMMGQSDTFVLPSREGLIFNGGESLVIHTYCNFHGRTQHMWYSIWQIGEQLRIGILLEGEAAKAPLIEGQNEIESLWPDAIVTGRDRAGVMMYEWEWQVPGFYDSWVHRERFAVGMRHVHTRMCRIIHDGTRH